MLYEVITRTIISLGLCQRLVAEVGAIAERRIALLIDPGFSALPAFLTEGSGA